MGIEVLAYTWSDFLNFVAIDVVFDIFFGLPFDGDPICTFWLYAFSFFLINQIRYRSFKFKLRGFFSLTLEFWPGYTHYHRFQQNIFNKNNIE